MRGLNLHLFLVYGGLLTLVFAITTWTFTRYFARSHRTDMENQLVAETKLVAGVLSELASRAPREDLVATCRQLANAADLAMILTDKNGVVRSGSPAAQDNFAHLPEMIAASQGKIAVDQRKSEWGPTLYTAAPVRQDDQVIALVQVSRTYTPGSRSLRGFHAVMLAGWLASLLIAAALAWWSVRTINQPLKTMVHKVGQMAHGDLNYRPTAQVASELAALDHGLTHLGERLQQRFQAVGQQQNEARAMLASMEEGVLSIDEHHRLLDLNGAAADLLRLDPTKARGLSIAECNAPPEVKTLISRALAAKAAVEELVIEGTDMRIIRATGTDLLSEDGSRRGHLVVVSDLTHLRRLEAIRKDFVANVSHELKTPITTIVGAAETLLEGTGNDPAAVTRFLEMIVRQAERLNRITEDLLTLARLEQKGGQQDALHLQPRPLREVIEAVLATCELMARDRNIELVLEGDPDLEANYHPRHLEQALLNLVDNAIKYSPTGGVVAMSLEKRADGPAIAIRDQGCGIAAEHLDKLFVRFYRVDKARSRSLGGTGLGLAIVKHIVRAHGGQVTVTSEPGQGSTFTIRLPDSEEA